MSKDIVEETIDKVFASDKAKAEAQKLTYKRTKANMELLALLGRLLVANPSERFGQLLRNAGFIYEVRGPSCSEELDSTTLWQNEFNTEPWHILERVKRSESFKRLNK